MTWTYTSVISNNQFPAYTSVCGGCSPEIQTLQPPYNSQGVDFITHSCLQLPRSQLHNQRLCSDKSQPDHAAPMLTSIPSKEGTKNISTSNVWQKFIFSNILRCRFFIYNNFALYEREIWSSSRRNRKSNRDFNNLIRLDAEIKQSGRMRQIGSECAQNIPLPYFRRTRLFRIILDFFTSLSYLFGTAVRYSYPFPSIFIFDNSLDICEASTGFYHTREKY